MREERRQPIVLMEAVGRATGYLPGGVLIRGGGYFLYLIVVPILVTVGYLYSLSSLSKVRRGKCNAVEWNYLMNMQYHFTNIRHTEEAV